MQGNKGYVNKSGGDNRLPDSDKGCRSADLFELRKSEFIAYCKGDEAERNIADKLKFLDIVGRNEAESVDSDSAEAVREGRPSGFETRDIKSPAARAIEMLNNVSIMKNASLFIDYLQSSSARASI